MTRQKLIKALIDNSPLTSEADYIDLSDKELMDEAFDLGLVDIRMVKLTEPVMNPKDFYVKVQDLPKNKGMHFVKCALCGSDAIVNNGVPDYQTIHGIICEGCALEAK